MNTFSVIRPCLSYLDSIVLRPSVTMSVSTYNRRTGSCSEQKSLSLSTGFTLLRGMMLLAGGSALAWGTVRMLRCKMRKKMLCSDQKKQTKCKK